MIIKNIPVLAEANKANYATIAMPSLLDKSTTSVNQGKNEPNIDTISMLNVNTDTNINEDKSADVNVNVNVNENKKVTGTGKQPYGKNFSRSESLASQPALPFGHKAEAKPILYNYFTNNKNENSACLWQADANLPGLRYSINMVTLANAKRKRLLYFNFDKNINILGQLTSKYLLENLEKLLISFFKSIYTLISKPLIIITADKIIIEILYFITIPDANIFKWYNLFSGSLSNNQSSEATTNSSLRKVKQKIRFLKRKNKSIRFLKRKNKSIKTILYKNKYIKNIFNRLNKININKLYKNKFKNLFNLLNSYFSLTSIGKKPIELDLIRIHHSYFDSYILAQLFSLILRKKNIKKTIHTLFSKNIIKDINQINYSASQNLTGSVSQSNLLPAFISGLYIHIGGRLMREPIIPRITNKKYEKGAIATGKINNLDIARITKKNKKGAFTIKIIYAQNLIGN